MQNAALPSGPRGTDTRWWMTEPVRFLQTNLSETDSTVDPRALVAAVADVGANTFLVNMGGIVAQYPTRVPFHYASTFLPPGRDLFGDVLRESRQRGDARHRPLRSEQDAEAGVRRASRVVLQAGERRAGHLQRVVLDLHQRRLLSPPCLDDSRERRSIATRWTGSSSTCSAIRRLITAARRWGPASATPARRAIAGASTVRCRPTADADYRAFMADSSREVAAAIAELIHRKRPRAAFLTYIKDHTDGIMSESNTAVGRPLPLWPYSASDNVSRSHRIGAGQDRHQPGDELHRLPVALRARRAGRDATAHVSEHGPRRSARRRRGGHDGAAGPQRADCGQAGLRLAQASRGSLRRPGERRARAAPGDRRYGVLSRLLQAADRAPHPVRRLREHALARGGDAEVRPGDCAGERSERNRALRAGRWKPARGRRHASSVADRARRRASDDAGVLADPGSDGPAVTARYRRAVRRRRLRRAWNQLPSRC